LDAAIFVPATATFQLLEVLPLVDDSHELVVAILTYISNKIIVTISVLTRLEFTPTLSV